MKYARFSEGNNVIETVIPPNGLTPSDIFHQDIAVQFVQVSDEVEQGWFKQQDGTFVAPPEPPPASEPEETSGQTE